MALPYTTPYPPPPSSLPGWREWALRLVDVVGGVLAGKLNATGAVTLTASATETTIVDPRLGASSVVLFMPVTASAAAAAGTMYVGSQTAGSVTVAHASDPADDQAFRFLIIA